MERRPIRPVSLSVAVDLPVLKVLDPERPDRQRLLHRQLPLTHKLLAIMLGVERPAVTIAVQVLERKGFLRAGRASITVIDSKE